MSRSTWRVRIVAAVAALLAPLVLAPSAQAAPEAGTAAPMAFGDFCPGGGGTMGLQPAGSPNNTDRCAGSYRGSLNWVQANNFATPVMKCAALKPYPDGAGPNVGGVAAVCAGGTASATQYHTPARNGYPTIISQGANYHTGFWGGENYN